MNKRFWVEVRVSYDGVTEKGEKANMKETWLVRAATFAESGVLIKIISPVF